MIGAAGAAPPPPDSVAVAETATHLVSAYVHVPFCARLCPYCDFAVVVDRDDVTERYVRAVIAEIDQEPEFRPLDAVFVGGGTPSRLPPESIAAIVSALATRFGLAPDAEVTLEANPEDWSPAVAEGMAEAGVTRVSFGAQSFDGSVLERLGRRHRPADIISAVETARRAGTPSVSLDLIYGTPGEDLESWRRTLEAALDLAPDHMSTYALTIEPATAFGRQSRRGGAVPDPDLQADMWEAAAESLAGGGLHRYEVSNHGARGHHCRYNLSVWGRGEYLAFGLGAHGFRGSVRTARVRRLDTYLERVESGIGAIQSSTVVEGWVAEIERLMLGLRRTAGVATGPGGEALLASREGGRMIDAGVLAVVEGRLVVTRPLMTDMVTRAVLALEPPSS